MALDPLGSRQVDGDPSPRLSYKLDGSSQPKKSFISECLQSSSDHFSVRITNALLLPTSLRLKMSCCGGNCGCGSGCKCGTGCGGCKMYPDLTYTEQTTTETLVMGVGPEKSSFEGASEMEYGAENGCKCGSNCTCDPCTCK
ncbi:hypothetical protein CRG98_017459 [Punica granatum]|uniref:Metallothionein-like protein n=2 Tax=Punica granatum TaxID=22663 RepID=A0A2I0K305_PUNGR|nr:hypothetical protein CRG98_017459 [Punica granatum]